MLKGCSVYTCSGGLPNPNMQLEEEKMRPSFQQQIFKVVHLYIVQGGALKHVDTQ